MLIYAGTKSDFMIDTENDRLETKLYENIKLKMNRTTGLSELNAWRNSLKEMYITLNDSDIPEDAGVAHGHQRLCRGQLRLRGGFQYAFGEPAHQPPVPHRPPGRRHGGGL